MIILQPLYDSRLQICELLNFDYMVVFIADKP